MLRVHASSNPPGLSLKRREQVGREQVTKKYYSTTLQHCRDFTRSGCWPKDKFRVVITAHFQRTLKVSKDDTLCDMKATVRDYMRSYLRVGTNVTGDVRTVVHCLILSGDTR
ncbi:hypothetical protein CYMTET_41226 [Cymbomonas tetramitiformis]|uniref:Uncharacterized protein n=1 Tax=Cymbomonas tetramitiformis TaxID=36881 RepID=A0AAE0F2G6_9CHLO|nr:hypothetical protein CYMTET_41226 [Cymbomonas tetramitiformis]